MRIFLTFLILLLTVLPAMASGVTTLWSNSFGGNFSEVCYSMEYSDLGGYALGGGSPSYGAGSYDFWLVRTDESGTKLWSKTYGGIYADVCRGMVETYFGEENHRFAMGGLTYSFGAGGSDFFLVITDSSGNLIASDTYGGAGNEDCRAISATSDDGYIMVGRTTSFGSGGDDYWLVKVDDTGDSLWSKTFGGAGSEQPNNMIETSDNGFAIVGQTTSFGAGGKDVWLVKTNANGDSLWSKTYGGVLDDAGTAIIQTSDGGYAIVGYTASFGASNNDVWLIKTNSNGDSLWSVRYGGAQDDEGYDLIQTNEFGYLIGGSTESEGSGGNDMYLIRTDLNGTELWTTTLGTASHEECFDLMQVSPVSYALSGYTSDPGSNDFWIVKVAENHDLTMPDWRFWIKAEVDPIKDYGTWVGGAEDATFGFDAEYDFPEPPYTPGSYISVYFNKPEWGQETDEFTSNVFPLDAEIDTFLTFEFEVLTTAAETITLTFAPDTAVTDVTYAFMHDPATDSLQNVRLNRYFTYESESIVPKVLELIIGTGNPTSSHDFKAGWNLMGFTHTPTYADPDSVIGDDVNDLYYVYDYRTSRGYGIMDDIVSNYGCWLRTYEDVTIDIEGRPKYRKLDFALGLGWNLISAPFVMPLAVNDLYFQDDEDYFTFSQAVDSSWILPMVFGYLAEENYFSADTLKPWQGYWIINAKEGLRILGDPYWPSNDQFYMSPMRFQPTFDNWHLEINSSSESASAQWLKIGVDPEATDGFDIWHDSPVPPPTPDGGSFKACFEREGWHNMVDEFMTDIRKPMTDGQVNSWTFSVIAPVDEEVVIDWAEIEETMPADYILNMTDLATGESFSIREMADYSFVSIGKRDFRIDVQAVGGTEFEPTIPEDYAITGVYPNPFNSQTTIEYALPEASSVTLSIFDMSGREVQRLSGSTEAGYHRVVWDAKDNANGIYFVRLQAGKTTKMARALLIK